MQGHDDLRRNKIQMDAVIGRRIKILKPLLEEFNEKLKTLPSGRLRISHSHEYIGYYMHNDKTKKNGKYIRKDDMDLIKQLAERGFLDRVIPELEEEIEALERLKYGETERIFDSLNSQRRTLLPPLYLSDEEFIKGWEAETYKGKPFDEDDDSCFYTETGIRVRSKSEVIIGDRLTKFGVPYKYEYPITIDEKTIYPDFTCLNVRLRKNVRLEHLGMMGNAEYLKSVFWKMNFYEKNGYKLGNDIIYTMESAEEPLDIRFLELMIKNYLL